MILVYILELGHVVEGIHIFFEHMQLVLQNRKTLHWSSSVVHVSHYSILNVPYLELKIKQDGCVLVLLNQFLGII